MGIFDRVIHYGNQDYAQLKAECIEKGYLFVDPDFPPTSRSLFSLGMPESLNVVWKRPTEICDYPALYIENSATNELYQGRLGNCWFVAACGCLAADKTAWEKVIPDYIKQEWHAVVVSSNDEAAGKSSNNSYAGIFKFCFWQFGDWVEVVIDDLLPCSADDNKPLYCHSSYKKEFWTSLLEKAYAKLHGAYENLEAIELVDALVEFTGGICESISLFDYGSEAHQQIQLFGLLLEEVSRHGIVVAGIEAASANDLERVIPESGLSVGRPYPVTAVRSIATQQRSLRSIFSSVRRTRNNMLRLRNPWGGAAGGWRGPYSEGSVEWEAMDRETRQSVGLNFEDDSEFWIPLEELCQHMTYLLICRQTGSWSTLFGTGWLETQFHGSWHGNLAGGCLNNKKTFLSNPQYMIEIAANDPYCLEEEIVICLTQKTTGSRAADLLHIGFTILQVENNRPYRVHRLEHCNVIESSTFKNTRSALLRVRLARGRFVIVPCTYQPELEADYLLRLLSHRACSPRELLIDLPVIGGCSCRKYPEMATRVTIFRAEGLERVRGLLPRPGSASQPPDVYCLLVCEDQRSTTSVVRANSNPEWNQSFIFYRRNPVKVPITIYIYHQGVIVDDLLGRQVFSMLEHNEGQQLESDLFGKNTAKERSTKRPGRLYLEMNSTTDFLKL